MPLRQSPTSKLANGRNDLLARRDLRRDSSISSLPSTKMQAHHLLRKPAGWSDHADVKRYTPLHVSTSCEQRMDDSARTYAHAYVPRQN